MARAAREQTPERRLSDGTLPRKVGRAPVLHPLVILQGLGFEAASPAHSHRPVVVNRWTTLSEFISRTPGIPSLSNTSGAACARGRGHLVTSLLPSSTLTDWSAATRIPKESRSERGGGQFHPPGLGAYEPHVGLAALNKQNMTFYNKKRKLT